MITCFLVEGAARLFQYQRGRTFNDARFGHLFRDAFYLGTTFKPNAVSPWQAIKNMRISEYGFRSDDFELEKAPENFRILTFGGSTSHARNYPKKLQTFLQAQAWNGKGVIEVINAATPTWNSTQSLIQFITRAIYLNPDMIIIYHAINDHNNVKYRWLKDLPMVDYEKYSGFLKEHSLAYNFLQPRVIRSYNAYMNRDWIATYSNDENFSIQYTTIEDPDEEKEGYSPQIFIQNIQNFIVLAKAYNISVVLVTMPLSFDEEKSREENIKAAGHHYTSTNLSKNLTAVNTNNYHLRRLATLHDTILIDAAHSAINGNPDNFKDLCHVNETGAQKLATMIASGITPTIKTRWAPVDSEEPR